MSVTISDTRNAAMALSKNLGDPKDVDRHFQKILTLLIGARISLDALLYQNVGISDYLRDEVKVAKGAIDVIESDVENILKQHKEYMRGG